MNITLVTPPLLQLNTPYPATPVLANYLKRNGCNVTQRDLSLETSLQVFTPEIVRLACQKAQQLKDVDDRLEFFLQSADDYARTVLPVVRFLQGKTPELAWRIAARTLLPEGPYFQALWPTGEQEDEDAQTLALAFGRMGVHDQAKYLASLYLDDLSSFIADTLDPSFCFGKYAERLAVALPDFDPLLDRLNQPPTLVDGIIEKLALSILRTDTPPDIVGLTIPFPGTLYGAFKIAQVIRREAPQTTIVFGGGYVNSELRALTDTRVFDFVDYILYDEGFLPLLQVCRKALETPVPMPQDINEKLPSPIRSKQGFHPITLQVPPPELFAPDYSGLMLDNYLDVLEMPNPMHRLWSDGKWLKMQLAKGCYWHKCAFCDVALDYIGRYQPAKAIHIVDEMERLMAETGRNGFHFVDEALSPALVNQLSQEIIRRQLTVVWWGNIRFDAPFNQELAQKMADSGCIAVTGGLECAQDRLLKLMNKGITTASAKRAFQAFAQAGILVHAYLMYAFPTETEKEVMEALGFVRDCFRDNLIQSAFWHRFALTTHSIIARHPDRFGITIPPLPDKERRFALNEIPFNQPNQPDWDRIGRALDRALYNYMLGLGLDLPPKAWLRM